jgi:hypothetical protein
MTGPGTGPIAIRLLLALACSVVLLTLQTPCASAAESAIEDRGAPAPGTHFRLSFDLPGWKQVYFSESAELQEEEEAEGVTEGNQEAATGDYSRIVKLSSSARCYLELESNAIFSVGAPTVSRGVVSGTGTHLLGMSRRELRLAASGQHGSVRWYIGSLHGGQIIGLTLQPAPPSLAQVGNRYLIAEFGLKRRAYTQPRDVYLSPPPSLRERLACLHIEQRTIRDALRPILRDARAEAGRYRPGKRLPGHALPLCVAERCPALLVTPSIEIYQTIPFTGVLGEPGQTFARWRANGRIVNVGVHSKPAKLLCSAGSYVAYPQQSYSKYPDTPTTWSIVRVDAATGARIFVPAFPGTSEVTTSPIVTDLVLAPDGALAWIVEGTPSNPRVNTVSRLPAGGSTPELLASREAVQPGTLALEAGVVRWREGSATGEAPLP